jgi:hypothetical protein
MLAGGCLVVENTATPQDEARRRPYAPVERSEVRLEGAVEQIKWPRSVRRGALESDVAIRLFLEKKNTTLSPPYLKLDITRPGTYGATSDLTPGRIPAEHATSYFLTFDPVGDLAEPLVREATLVFPEPILGLCVRVSCLRGLSDADALGDPGTKYETGYGNRPPYVTEIGSNAGRPIDYGEADYVVLGEDGRTLHVSLRTGRFTDQLRVVLRAEAQ